MNPEQRVKAIGEFGFTPRQAAFLDVVMRHAGVCLLRQYAKFAGIVHGQMTRAFFAKLVQRGYASAARLPAQSRPRLSRTSPRSLSRHWRAAQSVPPPR